jgi:hypothetical protein
VKTTILLLRDDPVPDLPVCRLRDHLPAQKLRFVLVRPIPYNRRRPGVPNAGQRFQLDGTRSIDIDEPPACDASFRFFTFRGPGRSRDAGEKQTQQQNDKSRGNHTHDHSGIFPSKYGLEVCDTKLHMYSKLLFGGSLFAAALLVIPGLSAADRPDPQVHLVEEIIAKVNGEIITRGELDKRREAIEAELRQQGVAGDALEAAVNKATADELSDQINQLLLVQKGKELNITVDADVNRQIAQIQSDSKIADPEKFHEWLQDQLHGISFEDFKLQTKNQYLTQRVISEEVYRNITIPQAEVQKYYEAHKSEFIRQEMVSLREILISVGDGSPEKVAAAEKKAKGLVDRLRKGDAKFPDLARQ